MMGNMGAGAADYEVQNIDSESANPLMHSEDRASSIVNANGMAVDAVSQAHLPDVSVDNQTALSGFNVVLEEKQQKQDSDPPGETTDNDPTTMKNVADLTMITSFGQPS